MPSKRDDREGVVSWHLMLTTNEMTQTSSITFYAIRWVKGLPTLHHRESIARLATTGVRGPIEAAEVLMHAAREVYGR